MSHELLGGGALPGLCAVAVVILSLAAGAQGEKTPAPVTDPITESLAWAYPKQAPPPAGTPPAPRPAPDATLRTLPGSALFLTKAQINDPHNAPDWYPEDHPPAPAVVLRGHGDLEACAHCHLPNGLGTAIIQAPSLAGLPADYIMQQLSDFKAGLRKSATQPFGYGQFMGFIAKNGNEEDLKAAADYFASATPKPWIRVVEAAVIPRTEVRGTMHAVVDGQEPIGQRIIEVPEDMARAEMRDPRSGFVAYVPPGSIRRGEVLATKGQGKTTPCAVCHGADLRGLGPAPPIAGRSPSYIVRQLNDLQRSARTGVWSALMKPVVAKLTPDDFIAIAAYTASREP